MVWQNALETLGAGDSYEAPANDRLGANVDGCGGDGACHADHGTGYHGVEEHDVI